MGGESNQNVYFNQEDASSFAEFEISEVEISRVDCISFQFDIEVCKGTFLGETSERVE